MGAVAIGLRIDRGLELQTTPMEEGSRIVAIGLRIDRGLEQSQVRNNQPALKCSDRSSDRSRIGTHLINSQETVTLRSDRSSDRSRIGTVSPAEACWYRMVAIGLRIDRGLEQLIQHEGENTIVVAIGLRIDRGLELLETA